MIKGGGGPFNLKNIFQDESIEKTKLGTQIWSHQSPIPYKNKWGIHLHK
jgi:hypothetical protein